MSQSSDFINSVFNIVGGVVGNQIKQHLPQPEVIGDEMGRWQRRSQKMNMEWEAGQKKDAIVRGAKGVAKTAFEVGKSYINKNLHLGLPMNYRHNAHRDRPLSNAFFTKVGAFSNRRPI